MFCQDAFLKYYNKDTGNLRYKKSFDQGQTLLEIKDGYLIVGYNEEDEEFVKTGIPSVCDTTRPMIIKIDKQGNVLWNKRYNNNTCLFSVNGLVKNNNNEYIGVGNTLMPGDTCGFSPNPYSADLQIYMQKINDNGDLIWQKTIGESINKTPQGADCITPTKDGNYFVMAGDSYYPWLLKINEQGDTLFTKKYPTLYNAATRKISSISDGYLVFANSLTSGLVYKINEQGTLVWIKNLPFKSEGIRATQDGNFIISRIYQPNVQIYTILTKIDKDVNILWESKYSTYANNSLCETKDDNYVLVNKDFTKVSTTNGIIWNKRFFGGNNVTPWYYINDVISTDDGGLLATGFYDGDTFLIKTDCNGNLEWDNSSCLLPTDKNVLIFPNPFNDILTIQLPLINKDTDKVRLQLTNTLGQIIFLENFDNRNIYTLQTSGFSDGVYVLTIFLNNSLYVTKKLVKSN